MDLGPSSIFPEPAAPIFASRGRCRDIAEREGLPRGSGGPDEQAAAVRTALSGIC